MSTWTREDVVEAIRSFHARHGYQPVCREASALYELPHWGIVKELYGSWNAAIEAAGFTPYPSRASAHAKRRAFLDRRLRCRNGHPLDVLGATFTSGGCVRCKQESNRKQAA